MLTTIAATTLMLTGPLGSVARADDIELSVLSAAGFSPQNSVAEVAAAYDAAWKQFEAENPGIHVKLVPLRGGPDALQDVLTLASTDRLPDVGVMSPGWLPRLELGGYLQPLDGTLTPEEEADFMPGILDAGVLDGHLRSIFIYNSWRGLFYRPSAVKAVGFDAPPTEWNAFLKFGDAVKKAGYKYALLYPALTSELTMLYLLPQYFGLGGELYDDTGKPDFFESPNREKLEQVMQMWRDLVVRDLMPASVGAMDEAAERPYFYSGETITVGSSTSFTQQMLLDQPQLVNDLNVVPLPMPEGSTPVPVISNWGYSLFAKDLAHVEAAKKFIHFMISFDVVSKLNALQGQLPVRQSIWKNAAPFNQGDLMHQLYTIQNDPRLNSPTRFAIYPAISTAISEEMADVVAGNISPSDAIDKARDSAMAAYQRLRQE
jgi:multiple sugar transport system substrate-binding protein